MCVVVCQCSVRSQVSCLSVPLCVLLSVSALWDHKYLVCQCLYVCCCLSVLSEITSILSASAFMCVVVCQCSVRSQVSCLSVPLCVLLSVSALSWRRRKSTSSWSLNCPLSLYKPHQRSCHPSVSAPNVTGPPSYTLSILSSLFIEKLVLIMMEIVTLV